MLDLGSGKMVAVETKISRMTSLPGRAASAKSYINKPKVIAPNVVERSSERRFTILLGTIDCVPDCFARFLSLSANLIFSS
jgi:hypothetical protein